MFSCCGSILFDVIIQEGAKHKIMCAWLWCWWSFWMCCCTKVLQRNDLNIHISIDAIVFILDKVCKNGYHSLIITMTKKYWNALQLFHASRLVLPHIYVPKMHTCGRWNASFCISGMHKLVWKSAIYVSIITIYLFLYIFFMWNISRIKQTQATTFIFVQGGVLHGVYTVTLSDQHKNVL